MPRPLYPEHAFLSIPDSLKLCVRCKEGLIYKPNEAEPFCMKCGDSGRPGELYLRASQVEELRSKAALLSSGIVDVIVRQFGEAAAPEGEEKPLVVLERLVAELKARLKHRRKGQT